LCRLCVWKPDQSHARLAHMTSLAVRTASAALTATFGSVLFSLAACSAGSQFTESAQPGQGVARLQRTSAADGARSGRSPRGLVLVRFAQAEPPGAKAAKNTALKNLYVSDFVPQNVLVLKNSTHKSADTISEGLVTPDGDFVDAAGNLYVSDYGGVHIQEYKPGGKSPSFTYEYRMIDPVDVSVDSHANVYEADYDGRYVNEYSQRSNTVIDSCSPGGGVEGVAVDANDDVFVDYNKNLYGSGKIAEYKGGLAGCHKRVFNVALGFAGGMALDAQDNLVVVDQNAPAVDVIAPPYSRITGTLGSGYLAPFHVTLSKNNKLAFVADLYDVFVINYPSGSLAVTLGNAQASGRGYGFVLPAGAVAYPNAVY
jgi:hypothetical protein